MAKSVSIPIALSELKRASLQRLSTRRSKKKDKPLNGFVIFVQETDEHVKLFGSVNTLEGYDIGDEIIAVNDVEVDAKSRDEILMHIKEVGEHHCLFTVYPQSIENRTIQLKVKRKMSDAGSQEEPSPAPTVTDAYVVCVDKDDVKKICNQLKQRFPEIRTFDMEDIANKLNNITLAGNARENHTTLNNKLSRGSPDNSREQQQKENDFLRSLAQEQRDVVENVESTSGYVNHSYEQPKDAIPLKQVIVSVERITEHLSHLEGREDDRQLLMNFFQSPSVQDAIQQTAEQHESVANANLPATGTFSTDNGEFRVVTLYKHPDSYLGATVRNEENSIVIGRVVKGGVVEKMGLLHEGDELVELNGVDLRGKRINEVCSMLRQINGEVRFVVSPSKEQLKNEHANQIIHLRALFDYDPEDDAYVPCKELALKFDRGDILHVLNTNDDNWWQAYRDGDDIHHQLAGLIPSSSFHQQVIMQTEEMEREKHPKNKKDRGKMIPEVILTLGRRSGAEIMRSADEPPLLGYHSQMLTYEEVQLHLARTNHPRPLVLCGPEGVGCLQLRQRLLQINSERLASPVPYTSRSRKEDEVDGVHYHFVSKQHFQELAKSGKFVEYGEYQKNWYGTAVGDIVSVIHKGMTCILSLKPESLAGIRIPSVMPYIVFISPPALLQLRRQKEAAGQYDIKDDQLKVILNNGKQIENLYGHLFDSIIVNTDMDKSHDELRKILKLLDTQPLWVPVDWAPPKTNGAY